MSHVLISIRVSCDKLYREFKGIFQFCKCAVFNTVLHVFVCTVVKCIKKIDGVPLNGHPGFCYGTMCYLEKNRIGHSYVRGCVDEATFDIEAFCSTPATESRVVGCCNYDNCNLRIDPPFPTSSEYHKPQCIQDLHTGYTCMWLAYKVGMVFETY